MKDRMKDQWKNWATKRKVLHGAAMAAGLSLFCLLLVPGLLVLIFSDGDGDGGGGVGNSSTGQKPFPGRIDTEDLEVILYREAAEKTVILDLEEYTAGVVAGEMPASFEEEALKAQAVAARTYSVSKLLRAQASGNSANHPDAPLCDSTHCQVYRSEAELEEIKGKDWMKNSWPKIQAAVADTSGQLLYYQGALVEQPLFHSSSGGQTENSEDVFVSAYPYLRSVDSAAYETAAPHQGETTTIDTNEFAKKINAAYGAAGDINSSTVKILSNTQGGRVEEIQVGLLTLTGRNIRELLGLRSANFTLAFSSDGSSLSFTTSGYGHGVGMSQYGANGMAAAGYSYVEILQHYYSGVQIE